MSTLKVNTILNAAGTGTPAIDGLAKAWVNFNGTGTVAIRAAFNVSSITDGGTGTYTVNFTNNMANENYAAVASGSLASNDNSVAKPTLSVYSVSGFRILGRLPGSANTDIDLATAAVYL